MLTRLIDKDEAILLIQSEEGHFFDKKSARLTGDKFQKILVALANADGGDVLIGVEDDKADADPMKRWIGLGTMEDYNGLLQSLHSIIPQVPATMQFLACKDLPGYALYIQIDKSTQLHKTASGNVYVRKGAQSLPLKDAESLVALKFAKGMASFEDVTVPTIPIELVVESKEMGNFLSGNIRKDLDGISLAVNENLLDLKTWDPKVSGIVLFSDNPSAYSPNRAGVRITRYETREEDPEREHLGPTYQLEGPAYPLIHQTIEKITAIMSEMSIWTVDGLKKLAYPPEAIWEVVVNAIIHRDYSISDDVQIHIYENRIEVRSPGKLPGFVTVDNILDVRHSRNKQIVRTLSRYASPPNKDMGEGLNTAFQKMKDWRLKAPIIAEVENTVVITIGHTPLANPEELVLEFLEKNERITNKQGREITGIKSENAMKNVFYALRDNKKILMIPKGNKTEWVLHK